MIGERHRDVFRVQDARGAWQHQRMRFPAYEQWEAWPQKCIAHLPQGNRRVLRSKPQCGRDDHAGAILPRREDCLQLVLWHRELVGPRREPAVPSRGRGLRGVVVESRLTRPIHPNREANAIAQRGEPCFLAAFYAERRGHNADSLRFRGPVGRRPPLANRQRPEGRHRRRDREDEKFAHGGYAAAANTIRSFSDP